MIRSVTVNYEKELQMELSSRCLEMGRKFRSMFLIVIAQVAILAVCTVMRMARETGASLKGLMTMIGVMTVITIALSIAFCAIIFSLGKYYDDFKSAGILFVLYQLCTLLGNMLSGGAGPVFMLISSFFGVLYVVKLASAMEDSFSMVNAEMADKWESYKKIFVTVNVATIVCVVLLIVPVLSAVASILLVALVVADVVLGVRQFILLGQSAKMMDHFVNDPEGAR
ncbi:MAG: hypothetical protein J5379_02725 [Clostridiales bacterium]|nr:hypothetical protein [Clostridiales bacterium]